MKRGLLVLFFVSLILILSLSLISANWFSDFWNKVTGKATAPGSGEVQPIQCTNECNWNSKKCSGNGYQTCGNYDSDFCFEWSSIVNCSSSENCINGQCMNDTKEPNVTLNYPVNNETFSSNTTIEFKCSMADDSWLSKVEFWIKDPTKTGVQWYIAETRTITGANRVETFNKLFSQESNSWYAWNCKSYDISGKSAWGNINGMSPGFKIKKIPQSNLSISIVLTKDSFYKGEKITLK